MVNETLMKTALDTATKAAKSAVVYVLTETDLVCHITDDEVKCKKNKKTDKRKK